MMLMAASLPTISSVRKVFKPPITFYSVTNFPSNTLDTLDSASMNYVEEEFSYHQYHPWESFFRQCCGQDVLVMFDILLNDERLLPFHILICNVLAMQPRCLFLANGPDRVDEDIWGMCSSTVESGDQIIRVDGVPQLLIVREFPDGRENAVKIISPLTLLKKRERPKKGWRGRREEEPFEEFNIY